ncbi:MAG: BMP family ABC transporter substrate-binding protein [Lachnospiraceae bacterium]|nr:BMP family ABC transporter substrate-binding protein [Ruminococcus sp.]MCM1274237.1 BMP family ABC transporter substrate-binding protein [Lachnospiraceae bacterium]
MTSKWLKRLAVLLALCMTIGLAGCNNEVEDSSSESSDTTSEVEETPRRVGYIFHDSADKNGFSGQMSFQRVKASNRSSMDTCYIDNVSITDFEKAVKALVLDGGCTEIVSGSPVFANVLDSVSSKYMNINFINFGSLSSPANTSAYTEAPYEGAYVAGMAAAYNSDAQKIGVVADADMLCSTAVINAAARGMQLVFGSATLYCATATRDSEIELAIDALLNNGCDVIICYTESPRSIEYCEQKGVKYIGSLDYSGEEENYPNMLMYFCSRRDSYFLAQFKMMKLDSWVPENYTGNMGNGVIVVSEALSAAKSDTQRAIDALVPKITSGAALVFGGEIKDVNNSVRYMQSESMSESQIMSMDWYVLGVEDLGSFRQVQTELPPNSFEIKS